jgi:hypothetical protein
MGDWAQLEADLNDSLVDSDLGEVVIYEGEAVEAVFEPRPVDVDTGEAVSVMTTEASLLARLTDLPKDPAEGDTVEARGVDYHVAYLEDPVAGSVKLWLHEGASL